MRIVQLTPGTGNFYCGTCLRDNALVAALRKHGHDAVLLPMYLPHFVDETSEAADAPLFFGGINVYLQQKSVLFRNTPAWLDRLLDAPALLHRAALRAGMTSAQDLGDLTLSMLLGEDGRQAKELEKVIAWLSKKENRPDVVSLSNALLIGLARRIRQALQIPVVCSLQGEDSFLDALPEPELCWQALRERTADVSIFIPVSQYYAGVMARRLDLAPERVAVVYNGIQLDGYAPAASGPPASPVIGYLARMHPSKGLDVLVHAFIQLKTRGRIPGVRLRIAGGQTAGDKPFVDGLQEQLRAAGCGECVEFLPNLDRPAKQAFLRTLSVLSVPATYGESFGLYLLEALASGVPVVQPAHAAFPELVAATGGGIVYEPGDPRALGLALETALSEPTRLAQWGRCGMQQVREKFTSEAMARSFAEVCERARL
ncbi:MAG: glycosyltransferase family 4 protein [Verrucomicrobia bacterium]|nr:glycosyltransferase family 4 protein [Verrucomicrobiota bacterium]